jgi:cell division protein FtsQ
MARKSGPTISQEELYPLADESEREDLDNARLLDLDVEQESPFLRAQNRVSVRRASLPRKAVARLLLTALAGSVLFVCCIAVAALYHYGERSWRFRVDSSDELEITGIENVTRAQVMEVMGGDIGRNIFFVPLAQRKTQLEQIPWVQSASVMRFAPNRLKIEIHERTPVAFARVGARILLVDAVGTLMEIPGKKKYSFPVMLGMNPGEPLSTRTARMRIYNDLVTQLDSSGAHYSQELSEIDLSDPEDVKVIANNPQGDVLVHLGSSNYLERYKVYVTHVQAWRQQFDKLESVDLRYDRQIIVNPDMQGASRPAPLTASAAKKAMAAGVKPAALYSRETFAPKASATLPKTAIDQVSTKPAARKNEAKTGHHKTGVKKTKAKARTKMGALTVKGKASTVTSIGIAAQPSKKPSPAIAKGQELQ